MKYAIVQTEWYEPMNRGGVQVPGTGHYTFQMIEFCDSLEEAKERLEYLNRDQFSKHIIMQVWT